MMSFRQRLGFPGRASTANSKEPKVAASAKPSNSTFPNNSISTKTPAVMSTSPAPSQTWIQAKPDQWNEFKEIRDLLVGMQNQMELISEIILSSPAEKAIIRESSATLQKFKLMKPAKSSPEIKIPSSIIKGVVEGVAQQEQTAQKSKSSSKDNDLAALVELRKDLEAMRDKITPPSSRRI